MAFPSHIFGDENLSSIASFHGSQQAFLVQEDLYVARAILELSQIQGPQLDASSGTLFYNYDCQETSPVQGAAVLVHVAPQDVMSQLFQNQAAQSNVLNLSQPPLYIWQPTLLQEDANLIHVVPQDDAPGLLLNQVTQYFAPTSALPQFPDWQLTLQEDANQLHDPSQFDTSTLQAGTPPRTRSEVCPICWKPFYRKQERDRHLRSLLPHCVYCPYPQCSWRGNRQDHLKKHWKEKHPGPVQVPEQQHCQIYDPDPLVKSILTGQLTVEEAKYMALVDVEKKSQELGKVGVWADLWGHKTKKSGH